MAEKFLIKKKAEIFGKGFQLFIVFFILDAGKESFPKTFEMPRPAPVCVF